MNYEIGPSMASPIGKRPAWQAHRLVQPLRGLLRTPDVEDVPEDPDSHLPSESGQDPEIEGYLTLSPPPRSRL